MKKLIALAAAGILTLSVAAFAADAAKTETKTTETKSTTSEMKKDDAGTMKKTTTHKKHTTHKKSTKTMEKKGGEKPATTEAAPKTN